MPFFNDIGARDEALDRPIWGAFALFYDGIERLVVVNALWALSLAPLLLGVGLVSWPAPARVALALLGLLAVVAASGALYAVAAAVVARDTVQPETVREEARTLALPALRALAPLLLALAALGAAGALAAPLLPLATLLRLALLVVLVSATYWGPVLAAHPAASAVEVGRRAAALTWRYPAETLATFLMTLLVAAIGVVSVAGGVTAAGMVVGGVQTQRHRGLCLRDERRAARRASDRAGTGPGNKTEPGTGTRTGRGGRLWVS